MPVEVWVRNPYNYIREVVEAGTLLVAWDRGVLVKNKIDPIKHAELYYGKTYPWRVLAIGIQGAAEFKDGDSWDKPTAVYPVWEYGEDMRLLEELIENPVGEDEAICVDSTLTGDERPVFGQDHRIVITNLPDSKTGPGRTFLTKIKELQEDYPQVTFHLHGLVGWRPMFSSGAKSVDIDGRTEASKGDVILPMGKRIKFEQAAAYPNWVRILGFKPVDLAIPRNRCMFNIKSAEWAAENWNSLGNVPMRMTGSPADYTTPEEQYVPPETVSAMTSYKRPKDGDKFACNTCSLSLQCKHFREGAVCSLPSAEPKELASYFKTRDSSTIIEGLTILTAANVRRLERGMRAEEQLGDVDKNVTTIMGQVFDQGTKLAKLIDPNLRGGTKVQVNVGQAGIVTTGNPRQAVAEVFRELELRGIPREQITPEMVQGLLAAPEDAQRAIEAPSDVRVIEVD